MTYPVIPLVPTGEIDVAGGTVTSATLQDAATADGNGTDFDITGMGTVRLTVIPTSFSATVTFSASADGTNFDVIRGYKQGATTVATSLALSGSSTVSIWEFPAAGLTKIRAALSGSSGTSITIVGAASPLPSNEPIGVTLSSAVLAAGSANIGAVQEATTTAAIAIGTTTAAGVVKASAGYLSGVLVSAIDSPTADVSIYDNASAASGRVIGFIPSTATAGSFWPFNMPAANGITVGKVNHSHALTVAYS